MLNELGGLDHCEKSLKEWECGWHCDFEPKFMDDILFHAKNLIALVGSISDVYTITDFWWIDFLVFTGN
jgi:hypothetical protein